MSVRTAAEVEGNADLEQLRDRADQTAREAARTLAELAARLSEARDPRAVVRRLAARTRRSLAPVTERLSRLPGGPRAARKAALVALPVAGGAVGLAAVAYRQGWLPSHSFIPNGRVRRHRR